MSFTVKCTHYNTTPVTYKTVTHNITSTVTLFFSQCLHCKIIIATDNPIPDSMCQTCASLGHMDPEPECPACHPASFPRSYTQVLKT